MNYKIFLLLITSSCVTVGNALNILVLEEIASPSHHGWFRTLNTALAAKGHNITVITPDEDKSTNNIHYLHSEKVYELLYHSDEPMDNFVDMGSKNVVAMMLDFQKYALDLCRGHVTSSGWKKLESYPDDFKFDLIIHDYIMGGCLIAFTKKFKNVPIIAATAFNDNFRVSTFVKGALIPSLTPYPFYNHNPQTFYERTFNFVVLMIDQIMFHFDTIPKMTAIVNEKSSFKDTENTLEIARKTILYLTNYDPAIDDVQQLLPNVIGVGGLQIQPAKKLPEDLQLLADKATDGLILFSLGTNVQIEMLGEQRIIAILETFRKLPKYTFIWKMNLETLPVSQPKNVYIRKWLPQNDILAHNNTKLFITHSGLLSTQESIHHGVPMLGIPIVADQFLNIQRSIRKGIAEMLLVKDLNVENLYAKLQLMLTQPKYRENIKIASNTFRDKKEKPLERALWWIDWVLRNPNTTIFNSSRSNLNFVQLESIDVIVFLASAVFLSIYILVRFIRFGLKCIFGDKKTNIKKKKTE